MITFHLVISSVYWARLDNILFRSFVRILRTLKMKFYSMVPLLSCARLRLNYIRLFH